MRQQRPSQTSIAIRFNQSITQINHSVRLCSESDRAECFGQHLQLVVAQMLDTTGGGDVNRRAESWW